ncbi:MAG: DegV family protein [Bacilli bacterium]
MKNKIGIICDSTSYLDKEFIEIHDISIVNLSININGNSYRDMIDIDNTLLFKMMNDKMSLTTSQPSPEQFLNAYIEKSKTYDKIICLTISSGLSGTYNSANLAKSMYDGKAKIEVIDTLTSGMGIRACIEKVIESNEDVFSKVVGNVKTFVKASTTFLTIDDLQTLVKTGRMKVAQALIGNVLKVKPLLTLDKEGKIVVYDKVRTTKKLVGKLASIILESKADKVYIAYAGSKEVFDKNIEILKERVGNVELILCSEIGPVLSTHLGKGGLGLFFTKNNA